MFKKKKKQEKIEIDLTESEGNAYYILGVTRILSKQLELDYNKIFNEMTSSDYENLLQVFEKYFGDFVIMYR